MSPEGISSDHAPAGPPAIRQVMQSSALFACILLTINVSAVFWIFPALDHAATGLFYSKETWFPVRTDPIWMAYRRFGIEFSLAVSISVIALVGVRILFWKFPAVLSGRKLAFLISTALLGPGLVVNLFLKDFWGRPRPHMVEEYGGKMPYTKVWEITDRCSDNCSFVSGEAASSIWLLTFVFLVPKEMRTSLVVLVGLLTATLSTNRIAFGGHFLSDIIISWSLMLFIILLMKTLILDRYTDANDPFDRILTGIGRRVEARFRK